MPELPDITIYIEALEKRIPGQPLKQVRSASPFLLRTVSPPIHADDFPEHVTAFRPGMAVHGKFGERCPVCGAKVQRIRYVANETNYCPDCQTGGKLLADRSLSLLLKKDRPQTPEGLEALQARGRRQTD
ncbi:MAG TPA: zinc finger domain-containing protein [Anaerolineales bacterium]|jgi:formamidopyrimidine-DNA glycosylase